MVFDVKVYLACFLGTLVNVVAQVDGSTTSAGSKAPEVFLQILNGVAPDSIDIELDGKVVFPSLVPGQRISSFGLEKNKGKIVVINRKTGTRKSLPLDLEKGYHTLILAGDFQALEGTTAGDKEEPPVRLFASIFQNSANKGESSVRVRIINGMTDKPIVVKGPHDKSWTTPPLGVEVATGLPEKLMLEAVADGVGRRNLYLSQKPPAKNLSVVFYPSGKGFAFRVMPESTVEGLAADQREAEQPEKPQSGESAGEKTPRSE